MLRKKLNLPINLFGPVLILLAGVALVACSSRNSGSVNTESVSGAEVIEATPFAFGIDVSHHNGEIDWKRVAQTPLLFVYIKATEGATFVDTLYAANLKGAKKAGYRVGSYHFFRMTSGAHDQFANFKEIVDRKKQDLIPMVDVETSDNRSPEELRDSLNVFIGLVRDYYGVNPMIYCTNNAFNELLGGHYPSYRLYIGRYGGNPPVLDGIGEYTIWQYTEEGHVEGIPHTVDLARFNPQNSIIDIAYK